MGWLRSLLSRAAGKLEPRGLRLDPSSPCRQIEGPRTFEQLFRALDGWLPEGSVLYFEGGSPDAEIESFMAENAIPEQVHIALGTLWPRPLVFHVPGTSPVLSRLAAIMDHHAEPELAWHFHVYRAGVVLLEWHDAFGQPMLVSGAVPDAELEDLAERFRKA